jgi:hypothetical protein
MRPLATISELDLCLPTLILQSSLFLASKAGAQAASYIHIIGVFRASQRTPEWGQPMYAVGESVVPVDLLRAFHNLFNQSFRSGSTKWSCRGGHCESVTSFCRLPKIFPDGDQPLGLQGPKELESKVFGKPENLDDGPGSDDETGGLTRKAANVPRWKPAIN